MLFFGLALMMINPRPTLAVTYDNQHFCPDYHPQRLVDLDELMGTWHIIEIIHHKREEGMVQGSIMLRVCPSIIIGRESMSDLRLLWREPSATFYYKIRIENLNHNPGFWFSSGPHNDSSITSTFFTHFTGTIQVMKAVSNHLVLTFCTTQNNRSLFSILVAREKKLSKTEVKGVNSMLTRRGLELLLSKYTCSGSPKPEAAFFFLLLVVMWTKICSF